MVRMDNLIFWGFALPELWQGQIILQLHARSHKLDMMEVHMNFAKC